MCVLLKSTAKTLPNLWKFPGKITGTKRADLITLPAVLDLF